jgi:hypothetical protein
VLTGGDGQEAESGREKWGVIKTHLRRDICNEFGTKINPSMCCRRQMHLYSSGDTTESFISTHLRHISGSGDEMTIEENFRFGRADEGLG